MKSRMCLQYLSIGVEVEDLVSGFQLPSSNISHIPGERKETCFYQVQNIQRDNINKTLNAVQLLLKMLF